MGKTKNFKSHAVNRSSDMKLKSILKEVKKQTNKYSLMFENIKKSAVLNEIALNGIMNSGVLTLTETKALRHYFSAKRITQIDESTVRRIDRDANILTEGWWDDTKAWAKGKKDDLVNAFKSGWSSIKKIWGKFKDLLVELAKKIRDAFVKVMEFVAGKIEAGYGKLKEKFSQAWYDTFQSEHPHEHKDLLAELKDLLACTKAIGNGIKNKFTEGKQWADAMINGTVEPEGDVKVDAASLENSIEKQTEALHLENRMMYEAFFSNKKFLSEMMVFEGHLEDALKGPDGKKGFAYYAVKIGMGIVKAVLNPVVFAVTQAIEMIAPKIFTFVSAVSKATGGPGIYEFALLTLMGIEVYEIVHNGGVLPLGDGDMEKVAEHGLQFILNLVPGLDMIILVVKILAFIVMAYSLGTIIYNIVVAFKHAKEKGGEGGEESGEPEPQTAGYKPSGQFKIQEGKLVFVS